MPSGCWASGRRARTCRFRVLRLLKFVGFGIGFGVLELSRRCRFSVSDPVEFGTLESRARVQGSGGPGLLGFGS